MLRHHDPVRIHGYCASCPQHGRVWSCPPFGVPGLDLLGAWDHAVLVFGKVRTEPGASHAGMLEGFQRARSAFRALLTARETGGVKALVAGHCAACKRCARPEPCPGTRGPPVLPGGRGLRCHRPGGGPGRAADPLAEGGASGVPFDGGRAPVHGTRPRGSPGPDPAGCGPVPRQPWRPNMNANPGAPGQAQVRAGLRAGAAGPRAARGDPEGRAAGAPPPGTRCSTASSRSRTRPSRTAWPRPATTSPSSPRPRWCCLFVAGLPALVRLLPPLRRGGPLPPNGHTVPDTPGGRPDAGPQRCPHRGPDRGRGPRRRWGWAPATSATSWRTRRSTGSC